MNQGDVYWHTFHPPDKRRPVLILMSNSAIPNAAEIIVASITSVIRGIRSEVLLTPEEDGVLVDCVVSADNIHTVPKASLESFLTHLSGDRMREVREAIEYALGFDAMQ